MSYIQNTDADRKEMRERIGISSFDEILEPIPERLRCKGALRLDEPLAEAGVAALFGELAGEESPRVPRSRAFSGEESTTATSRALVRYVTSPAANSTRPTRRTRPR